MKLKETLTTQQTIDIISGQSVGLFPYIFQQTDLWYSKVNQMCLGYYMYHSGEKSISPAYKKVISLIKDYNIVKVAEEVIGTLIRETFIEKWNKVYDALITSNYDFLNNDDYTESRDTKEDKTNTYNTTIGKTGNNQDITTFDTNVEDNGTTGVKETTSTNNSTANSVFGFNSTTAVGESNSVDNGSETFTANANDNTTHNLQEKSGTESTEKTINETDTKTGTDNEDLTRNEEVVKSGRNVSGATLIKEELDLRDEKLFFDIIYRDIDSIATLKVYC